MIYFQPTGHSHHPKNSETLSLAGLFSRIGFIHFVVCLVKTEVSPKAQKMPKRKKLVEQIFRTVFTLPKTTYFAFSSGYRRLADQNLEVLEYLLSEAIANSQSTPLPVHNVTLQFCFFCLVDLQHTFNIERLAFAQLIYTYVKTLVES